MDFYVSLMKFPKGISAIEILIVVFIIAILAFAATANFAGSKINTNDAMRVRDMQLLSDAVKSYFTDTGEVPNNIPKDLDKTADLDTKLGNFYIEEIPNDPAPEDNSYRYVYYLGDLSDSGFQVFEFNARLEAPENDTKEINDGGNVTTIFEVGRSTQILGAGQTVGTPVYTACDSIQWGNTLPGGTTACPYAPSGSGGGGGDCSTVSQCNGLTATICVVDGYIVGGPDNGDLYAGVLTGGNFGNVIVGTSGNDIINGDNGVDTICGLAGDDTINGKNSNDILFGQDGNDTLYGENGQDIIDGGAGIDTADGGAGPNTCTDIEIPTGCA